MSVVLDTHAWLWWVTNRPLLSSSALARIEEAQEVVVPAIALWEVAMLVEKGRLVLDRPVGRFLREALSWRGVELAPITPDIAARSSAFAAGVHGDPADRLIAATALELALPLVTRDIKIARMPGVETLW